MHPRLITDHVSRIQVTTPVENWVTLQEVCEGGGRLSNNGRRGGHILLFVQGTDSCWEGQHSAFCAGYEQCRGGQYSLFLGGSTWPPGMGAPISETQRRSLLPPSFEAHTLSHSFSGGSTWPPDMGVSFAVVSGKLVIQPQVAPPVINTDSLGPYEDSVVVRKWKLVFFLK